MFGNLKLFVNRGLGNFIEFAFGSMVGIIPTSSNRK